MYITITGSNHYMGIETYHIGQTLYLKKDHLNNYDDEAIKVVGEHNTTYGYVANSVLTVARGTMSAGRIYDKITKGSHCKILFILEDSVIAQLFID